MGEAPFVVVAGGHEVEMADLLRASEVNNEFGLSRSSLLRYERAGTLVPERTPGGQRRYRREQIRSLMAGNTAVVDNKNILIGPERFNEWGSTGLRRWGGSIYEERLKELQGRAGRLLYREMRLNDPVISAMFFAVVNAVKQADWSRIESASDKPDDKRVAEFVESALGDMSWSFSTQLDLILYEMFEQGFSIFEVVFKKRLGENPLPYMPSPPKSFFDDGMIGWRKWSPRPALSLASGDEWIFDNHGGIQGINQLPEAGEMAGRRVTIPIQKMLHFRTTAHPALTPEGQPLHRSAYIPYYFTQNLMETEGIGLERDLGGLPVVYLGHNTTKSGTNSDYIKSRDLVRNIRVDEQAGVVIPHPKLGTGNEGEGVLLELLSSPSRRQYDTSGIIERYDKRKALSVLAQFIMLGMDRVGSYALSAHQGDLFIISVTSWMNSVADVINRHAIPKLVRMNVFPGRTGFPKLRPGAIGIPKLTDLAMFVNNLVDKQVLTPDRQLEAHLRQAAGFPPLRENLGEIKDNARRVDEGERSTSKSPDDSGGE